MLTSYMLVILFHTNPINISISMENRTARLTLLIDPRKKKIFEEICAIHDVNEMSMK